MHNLVFAYVMFSNGKFNPILSSNFLSQGGSYSETLDSFHRITSNELDRTILEGFCLSNRAFP